MVPILPHDAYRTNDRPRDPVVPLAAQSLLVEALQRLGGHIRFTVYPEAEHDSWTATYDNPELYAWMLALSR